MDPDQIKNFQRIMSKNGVEGNGSEIGSFFLYERFTFCA